jgi:hypothetical protein
MVAQMFQPFDEAPRGVFRLQLINKVAPGFTIRRLALDHRVGHDAYRLGHSHHRAFRAAPYGEPPVLGTSLGTPGPRGGVGCLHPYGAQEAMALAGLA